MLQRKVWMQWGHTQVFPNQYIVLVGESGVRKNEPIIIARSFMQDLSLELIAESITKEAMIRRMKDALRNFEYGRPMFHCSVSCVLGELAVFLTNQDPKFLADLTDWYDCKDEWTYDTKHAGTDRVQGVCINILAAMAPDWVPVAFPQSAIGGGLTSRMMFVVEHRKGRDIPDPNEIEINSKLRQDLLHDLEHVLRLAGEMTFDRHALEMYKEWYIKEEKSTAMGRPAIADPRFAGYVSRRSTHLRKTTMAISAARSDSLTMTEADLSRALSLMEQAEENMPDVFGGVGRSFYSEQTQAVMDFIKSRKSTTRSEVMKVFYRDIDGKTIEIIESTLRATKLVDISHITDRNDYRYRWSDD